MTAEQRIAFTHAQSTAAMIEAMGMQAENRLRLSLGQSIAYGDEAFSKLIDKYGLEGINLQHFLVVD